MDGDIVHGRPNGFYRKPYEYLCEPKCELNHCAWTLMGALRKDLQRRGGDMIILAKRMGESLAQAIEKGEANWVTLSRELEQIKNQYLGSTPHYYTETVLRAAKTVLNDFRYGERIETKNLPEVMVEQYMKQVYQSQFEARIAPIYNHGDLDDSLLSERLQDIQPHIYNIIDEKWAKKATANEDVSKLRRPKRQNINKIDMEEDLL
ncbi:hypothetical protein NG798_24125 [Ancylothrix sp. C2]|nr:hypothetical protein [Ancylothrix sp. D3o]